MLVFFGGDTTVGSVTTIAYAYDTPRGPRPINDVHDLRVFGNVFSGIGQSAVEFNDPRNAADGNVYGFASGRRLGMQPYLRVKFPEPPEWDNLESWRDQHDWDNTGTTAEVTTTFNPDALQLSLAAKGDFKAPPVYDGIDVDFYGHPITGTTGRPGLSLIWRPRWDHEPSTRGKAEKESLQFVLASRTAKFH